MIIPNILKNRNYSVILFLILYISLLAGFFFNENATGGAIGDYGVKRLLIVNFSENFIETLLNFDQFGDRHTPVMTMYFSIFEKLKINETVVRFFHLHIALLVVFAFYKTLKLKYYTIDNRFLYCFALILLLSPTIRSTTIWPDSRTYGLLFFILSVFFFIKFQIQDEFKYAIYNTIILSISSYISLNFAVFSLFFFLSYLRKFGIGNKIALLFLLNVFLALPAFYYLFVLDVFFITTGISVVEDLTFLQTINPANKIILISSIFLFHMIPFFAIKEIRSNYAPLLLNKNLILISFFVLIPSIFFFSYQAIYTGGGIFFHMSNLFFENNLLIYFIGFFSILILAIISRKNFDNFLLLLILLMSNPQLTIYHKYYDPLIWILLLLLFNLKFKAENIFNFKIISFFYIFSIFFLSLNYLK